jgi:nitrite transporter
MPVPVPVALGEATTQAVDKSAQVRRPARYLVASALAGVYVGVAVVVLLSVGAPLAAAASPATKLISGVVFGIALALVVFAGAELFTGNVMTMLYGRFDHRVGWWDLTLVWVVSLLGNLAGSVLFGLLVSAGGTLRPGTPGATFLDSLIAGKVSATGPQLFARAVLCNMLVCLALWMAMRTTSDGAKLAVLWWPLLAFIGSGFEHCVANMTLFTLGVANGDATWLDLARNLVWTVPGNVVGGGLLVAAAYRFVGRAPSAARNAAPTPPNAAPPVRDRQPVPERA